MRPLSTKLADALRECRLRLVTEALRSHDGNVTHAARELGLSQQGLCYWIKEFEIKVERKIRIGGNYNDGGGDGE